MEDSAYLTSSIKSLNLLLQGVEGEWGDIPESYLRFFHHDYADGDVSLLPLVDTLSETEDLEKWQVDEVVEILTKVDPYRWPDLDFIEEVNASKILEDDCDYIADFVEDNLGTSEKAQKVLKAVIESVFGATVSAIRSKSGKYPSPANNFLQEKDGTFSGTFKFDNFTFEFEIVPTESEWICTYRLDEKSLDKLGKPEFEGKRKNNRVNHRKVRSQGWR